MTVRGNYSVRKMTVDEVEKIAIEWAAQEGWYPGLHDAAIFHATDPEGFFVGMLDGEPVACMSAVAYNSHFGFIGFYIVKPGFRKEGYSIKLVNAATQHLSTQNIGLDGVVEQQANYQKIGFKIAYRNIRYIGETRRVNSHYYDIVRAKNFSFDSIAAYDTQLFPAPRHQFLKQWLVSPGSNAFVSVQKGKVTGYGVIRPCQKGYKIGPLFANSKEIARQLLITLTGSVYSGEPFYLDIPEPNPMAIELTRTFQMKKVFETARMYSKSFPKIELNNVFGVTSFELG